MAVGARVLRELALLEEVAFAPSHVVVGVAARGTLVVGSTAEGHYHLYALDPSQKVLRRLTRQPVHLLARAHPASQTVVFTRDVSMGRELSKVFSADVKSGMEAEVAPDVEPQRIAGLAFDGKRVAWSGATREYAAAFLAEPGKGAEELARLSGREFVTDVNEKYVVGFGSLRGDPFSMELFIIDLSSRELHVFTPREGSTNVAPKLRGDTVLFSSDYADGDKMRLYTYSIEEGTLREVDLTYRDMERFDPTEFVDYGWTEDGRVWAVAKRNGRTKLFVDGREVPTPPGFISSAEVHEGAAYVVHSSLRSPPRVLSIDLETGESRILVDNRLSDEVSRRLGDVRFAVVESSGGVKVPVFVLESRVATKPGPAVIYPHGGPWSEVADSWSPMIASLAVLGYHVVAPNFRGSTGYGQKYRKMDIGDPGGGDLQDVVSAALWAVEQGIAEREKLAILGYSYGGFMTLTALTRAPDIWRCGVAGAAIADWREQYELADAYFRRFTEILFGGKLELMEERSPITYVESLKAPVCIIHPQNDTRTPLRPIMRFASKLMEHGKLFELHVIPGVGHAISLDRRSLLQFLVYAALFLEREMRAESRG
ncbi:MAG: S9 family peptidase [Thermoproteota archaeon]